MHMYVMTAEKKVKKNFYFEKALAARLEAASKKYEHSEAFFVTKAVEAMLDCIEKEGVALPFAIQVIKKATTSRSKA